ncbi:hypothetical protein [Neptunicoccus sediminis]|uniref:hypothetical protein n=1 Tax=Neptunicoccus sediminis TaxID=1892596 RepID=UPI000845E64D|nr:hypothetical protein [Neptunicoccus sediminis]
MRRLYLHIGNHRTATSSIQSFMAKNAKALRQKGVLYPYNTPRHLKLMNNLFDGTKTPQEVAKDLDFRAESKNMDIHSILLSDEDISCRRDLSVLAKFREFFDVKVIFCLRRQDLWLESWYFQNVKWQWRPALCHLTVNEFFDRRNQFPWMDYKAHITHLEKLFGRENVLLNVFERDQMPEGPVHSFAQLMGLELDDSFTTPPKRNASLTPLVSEMMRCLPLDEAPTDYRVVFDRACGKVDKIIRETQPEAAGSLILSHEQRRRVLEEHAAGNAWVAERYFGRKELFQDPVPDESAKVSELKLPADSYETMETLVAPLVRALIDAHKAKSKQ